MIPSLQHFTRALLTPDLSFDRLRDARAVTSGGGLPRLMRTTRFAEAEIRWQGERWLLWLPLSPATIHTVTRTAMQLKRLNTASLTPYRILPGEFRWTDSEGRAQTTDLVLQHLPAGKTFAEALLTESGTTLLAALGTLERDLRALAFAHNNLKAANLRWCGDRFVPLRYHDARIGDEASYERDAAAFEALRTEIAQAGQPLTVGDTTAAYDPLRRLEGHLWTSHVFEGLVCVEDATGFGFVDTENRPVIPAQFLWAGDFREGRAEVETPTGMGLIDREGRYVIQPEFEIVEYDPAKSIVHVRSGGRWALFDYLGRRLTEFGTKNEL